MRVAFLWIGRTKNEDLERLVQMYRSRLQRYCRLEIVERIPSKERGLPPHELRKKESTMIRDVLNDRDILVLLDQTGQQMTSDGLAETLQRYMNQGTSRLVFAIGGAHGVDEAVFDRANAVWSLSRLTFTHDMARVIAMEQVYRGFTILGGEHYHNA